MHLLNQETTYAICWTLIHSLWQGLLLAILAGLVIMLTNKSSSAIRYIILSGLFFLFIVTACFTFSKEYSIASAIDNVANIHPIANIQKGTSENAFPVDDVTVEKGFFETFVNYFNEHASLIVMIWFVALSAQGIKLIANAGYVQRIKHYRTHAPSEYWNARMLELAKTLNIKQRVLLLQSEIVRVPVMVGFLKPVILFPFSLMSKLPPEQVEAVLLHELAHIRRKDYFVNLVQNFAEIIFFFNPAVLWISSLIRDERENCCDDIALAETKSKKEFIHALVSFQEYNLSSTKYSLAFPGRKNHLLNRVKRIITNNNKTLNNMEKISLATGIVIIGLMTIAFKQTTRQNTGNLKSATNFPAKQAINDTVPDKIEGKESHSKFTYKGKIDGTKYELHETDDVVKELYVNGKKIAQDKIADYAADISKMHRAAKEEHDKLAEQNEILEKQRADLTEQQEIMKKKQAELNEINDKINSQAEIENSKNAKENELSEKRMAVLQELDLANSSKAESQEIQKQLRKQNDELMALTDEMRKRQTELKEQIKSLQQKDSKTQNDLLNKQIAELNIEQMQIQLQRKKINELLQNTSHEIVATPALTPIAPATNVLEAQPSSPSIYPISPVAPVPAVSNPINAIIDDLIDENVITDKDNLSFTLNGKVLIVNNVTQPEELHTKLKERYIKGAKDHMIYARHGGSIHTEVITHSE